jgi:hypothetical protein
MSIHMSIRISISVSVGMPISVSIGMSIRAFPNLQLLQVRVRFPEHPYRERELEVRVGDGAALIEYALDRLLRPRAILCHAHQCCCSAQPRREMHAREVAGPSPAARHVRLAPDAGSARTLAPSLPMPSAPPESFHARPMRSPHSSDSVASLINKA